MKQFYFRIGVLVLAVAVIFANWNRAEANSTLAYISDSPSSSVPFWVAKDAGIFKKHGLSTAVHAAFRVSSPATLTSPAPSELRPLMDGWRVVTSASSAVSSTRCRITWWENRRSNHPRT